MSKVSQRFCFVFIIFICQTLSKSEGYTDKYASVQKWAQTLGNELWRLGEIITKNSEMKLRYRFNNAEIIRKEPDKLLDEFVLTLTRMMDRKMDAIKCIIKRAEEVAEAYEFNMSSTENYTYYNSKFSTILDATNYTKVTELEDIMYTYNDMSLNHDTHFYNIPVNTSYSSVHVPTNIYDREREVAFAIQWSEELDDIFKQNYRSDPALSWQYFGSSSGIMRHYPAMQWIELNEDIFDCRIRTWFIEASTCTKDVVILLDNSGSMTGMRKHIAAFTVKNILDTFSNNDYINLLNYSTKVDYIVPCFNDQLIQATRENIQLFKLAVEGLEANEKSQLKDALTEAFTLLHKKREQKGCSGNSSDCNQAIMLVTDGVPRNMSDILLEYNLLNNGSSIPVRIFTYLIGKEVTNVDEIMWMSCANRGFYTHVRTLEEVTGAVLKYIPVIARPLVLQQEEHPASWTHAYVDQTYNDDTDDQINEPYRLLTTVAAPAYDVKLNNNNDSRTAELLGVAATDVPIDDIRKLISPYRIGVNGYAFVVTNNGYVLWHPALRPMLGKILKENFNSVDFTEVEQLDDELNAREIGDKLLELRNVLVNGERGVINNVTLKYHYDNTRRVTKAKYDYYFAPIKNTPFTIGISLPQNYGQFSVQVGNVINKNNALRLNLTTFFEGGNWKIHPKWIYCKYHYLEGHEFDTPESELIHFLKRTNDVNFKWRQQYESEGSVDELDEVVCGRKTLDDNDYYCDKSLMQTLIFDATSTYTQYMEPWTFKNGTGDQELFEKYNASLRFVATMSGLTRWEYIYGESENITKKEFGDYHARAIDEQWYKSAVLQHQYDKYAFVFSVPFDIKEEDDLLVTASHAIFPEDGGIEAPGAVVGFQFSHASLEKQFLNIIKCDDMSCYLIDHSGYVIVSQNNEETGKFFGEVVSDVMQSMVDNEIYVKLTIFDYQGICYDNNLNNIASTFTRPFDYMLWIFKIILSKIMWIFIETNIWNPNLILANPLENEFQTTTDMPQINNDSETETAEEQESYRSCDKYRSLYFLNQTKFIAADPYPAEIDTNCSRMYYIKKVVHSNMLFVAAETIKCDYKNFDTDEEEILYNNTYQCQKLNLNYLTRRRLAGCFNEHPLEHEITACGRTSNFYLNLQLFFFECMLIIYACIKSILG